MNSKTRIYTNVARDRIVEEGDPEAAFLVASAGGDVPPEYAHVYQEYRKAKDEPVVVVELAPQTKAKAVEAPPENKARVMAEKK